MGEVKNNYRKDAKKLLLQIEKARIELRSHKPSIGYVGERLLSTTLEKIIPKGYGICQGFVRNNNIRQNSTLSKQCDIIIYKKGKTAIYDSFGDIKIINASYASIVIEVKSSISQETFNKTLNSFERLCELGITDSYLFVYNRLSKGTLSKWLYSYKNNSINNEIICIDNYVYDWSDLEWLPNAIISLKSEVLFSIDYVPLDSSDWLGYMSYVTKDSDNIKISCLQEFLYKIKLKLELKCPEVDYLHYSLEDGILLFR